MSTASGPFRLVPSAIDLSELTKVKGKLCLRK
jgi:hypothetical protein